MLAEESIIEDWTSGYVADVGYTYGYYRELNPHSVQVPFLAAGLVPPQIRTACELGFGQGLSINCHAAASGVEWWGTDFNPSHAAFAQELARASSAPAQLFDQSFEEFCARTDLPQMDYIGLHGIWSWISDENRRLIVDFVRRKLNVGGVLYLSYNTQPGWAAMVPMRELLVEHAAIMAAPGQGRVPRVDAALAFADQLVAANPAFTRVNPHVVERLKQMATADRNYLAHEYFNRDWQPMSFARMSQWLAPAKLSYACSAHGLDLVDSMNLTTEQQALLAAIPDPGFRQTVRDFCVNQGFRRDYWVRGARPVSLGEQMSALRRLRIVLLADPSDVTMKVTASLGELNLREDIYRPLLEALGGHGPKPVADLERHMQAHGANMTQLLQALIVLMAKGAIDVAQGDQATADAQAGSLRLNRLLMEKSALGKDLSFLSSPVTGGAFMVNRCQQLFLDSVNKGRSAPEEWAADAWANLSALGQRLRKAGKTLETPEENQADLLAQANEFASKRLAVLKKLVPF